MNRNDVDVNRTGLGGDTSLHSAAARGGHEVVGERSVDWGGVNVDSRDGQGNTPSSEAARDGHREAVEILLERRVDLNAKKSQPTAALFRVSVHGDYEVVKLLLQFSADANAIDRKNRTPLIWAAAIGHYEVVKLLLQRSSNADHRDTNGRTPSPHAARNGHEEIVGLFVERSDIDVNSKDTSGRSPLSWALGIWPSSSWILNFIDSIGGAHYLDVVDEDPAVMNLGEVRQLRIGSIRRLSYWLSKDTTEQYA